MPVPYETQNFYRVHFWFGENGDSVSDQLDVPGDANLQVLWPSCTVAISSNNTQRTATANVAALTGRPSSTGTLDITSTNIFWGTQQHATQHVTLDANGNAAITTPVDNRVSGGDYKVTASFVSDNVAVDTAGTKMRCNAEKNLTISIPPPQPKNDTFNEVDNGPGDQLDVLANDVVAPGVTLKIVGVTQPAHGSVSIQSSGGTTGWGYLGWSNNEGAYGPYTDTFTYTVEDSLGRQASAQVTLNVACGFAVVDATYTTKQGQARVVPAPGFAANNRLCGKVAPAGRLETPPKHGSLTLGSFTDPAQAGAFTYTPEAGFVGVDWFDYSYDGEDPIGTVYIQVQSTTGDATTTSITSDKNPALINQSVNLTVKVVGGAAPTGKVQLFDADSGAPVCDSAYGLSLTDGKATCPWGYSPTAGTFHIVALYAGDANHISSKSATFTQVVSAVALPATTTSLASSKNPSNVGDAVTLTATVSGGASPTGTVTFNEGTTLLCNAVTLSGTTATCSVPQANLTQGTHSFTATYSGDTANAGSISATFTQTVNAASTKTRTATTLSLAPNPAQVGQSITASVSLVGDTSNSVGVNPPKSAQGANSAPSATVPISGSVIVSGGGQSCMAAVSNSMGSCTLTFATAGSYTITASFPGDANNQPSSDTQNLVVVAAASAQTVAAPMLSAWMLAMLATALGGAVWLRRRSA